MGNTKKENIESNHILKKVIKISDETGVSVEMIGHIFKSLTTKDQASKEKNLQNPTRKIIQNLIQNSSAPAKEILTKHGISSSSDFGLVVKKLCEEELLFKEEEDDFEIFEGQFETTRIENYIKDEKIRKNQDWFKFIANCLYFIGFVVVISSYFTRIPNKYAWSGWGIGMVGWLLLLNKKKIKSFISNLKK